MSMGGVSALSVCGCNCHPGVRLVSTEPCDPCLGWEQCNCVLCGEDGCRRLVSPLLRLAVLVDRGRPPQNIAAELEGSPNYCGDCRDHNLLEIRRAAVRRARAKRQKEKAESVTKARIQRGASKSRSPVPERRKFLDQREKVK